MKKLLGEGKDPNERGALQLAALHAAVYGGHIEAVKLLLDHKADPDAADNQGMTPLHIAAIGNRLDVECPVGS